MTTRQFLPFVESLENRLTPGVVTIAVAGGVLSIVGSPGNDSIALSQRDFGSVTLTPNATTAFAIGGTLLPSGTVISLGSFENQIRSLNVSLGGGNDTFTFDQTQRIDLLGNVTVDLGGGNDVLNQVGSAFLSIEGSLTIRAGGGNDAVTMTDFNVRKAVSVTLGNGVGTSVNFTSTSPDTQANCLCGGLNITAGIGNKSIHIDATTVAGQTTIFGGSGNCATGINAEVATELTDDGVSSTRFLGGLVYTEAPSNVGNTAIRLLDGTFIGRNPLTGIGLSIRTAAGNDTIALLGTTVTGPTAIFTGGGNDRIELSGDVLPQSFGRAVLIDTGDGNDSLAIEQLNETDFHGRLDVHLGGGTDSVTLGGGGALKFDRPAFFDGGVHFDRPTTVAADLAASPFLPQCRKFF